MSEFNDVFPAVFGLHSFYFLYGGNRYCWWFRNPAITTCDVSKGYILHVNWCRISSNSMSFSQLISIEDVKRLKSHSGFLRQQSWQISEDYAMWLPHLLAVTLPLLPIFLFIFALQLAKKTMVFRIERKLGWCNRSTGQPVETRNEELELNGDKRSIGGMKDDRLNVFRRQLLDGLWRFFISLSSFGCPDGWCSETFAARGPCCWCSSCSPNLPALLPGSFPEAQNHEMAWDASDWKLACGRGGNDFCGRRRSRVSAWLCFGDYFRIFSLSCWEPP